MEHATARIISSIVIIAGVSGVIVFSNKEKSTSSTTGKYDASLKKIMSVVVLTIGVITLASTFVKKS